MAVLVATLIDQGKLRSDRRGDASIADADWLVWTNRHVESLWRLVTNHDPEAYFSEYDFTLAGGTAGKSKDLGTGPSPAFRALHGLELSPDTVNRRTVPRINFKQRNIRPIGWWTPAEFAGDRGYDLRARTLVVSPYESAAGNYRAYYRGAPYLFTSAVDATPLDWQLEPYAEYIEIMNARDGLGQEESETGYGSERLAEIRAELAPAQDRDDGEAAVIADVEEDGRPWWPYRTCR